jgi:hypothetical protein
VATEDKKKRERQTRSFTDGAGRVWIVELNVTQLKRVRDATGIHLSKLVGDSYRPLSEFLSDPPALCDVLYVLCREQADKVPLTDEQFGRALAGDVLQAAADCFVAALADFLPGDQGRLLESMTARAAEFQAVALGKALEAVLAIDVEKELAGKAGAEKAAGAGE